jgi:hypothetical protein
MPFPVTCPECDSTQKVPDEAAGKRLRCKGCQTVFRAGNADVDIVAEGPPPARTGRSRDDVEEPRPSRRRPRDDDEEERPRRKSWRGEDEGPRARRGAGKAARPKEMSQVGLIGLIGGVGALLIAVIPCTASFGIAAGVLALATGVVGFVLAKKSGTQGLGMPIATISVSAAAILVGAGWLIAGHVISNKLKGAADGWTEDAVERERERLRRDIEAAEAEAVPKGPPIKVTAGALCEERLADPDAVEEKYNGKPIEITGVVTKSETLDPVLTITLEGTDRFVIWCTFVGESVRPAQAIVVGQTVTIRGNGSSWIRHIFQVHQCTLVSAQ